MKHITTFHINGRDFECVENNDGWFLAIEHKYITNRKLNRSLNGLEIHAGRTVNECFKNAVFSVEFDKLIEAGYTRDEALWICSNFHGEII